MCYLYDCKTKYFKIATVYIFIPSMRQRRAPFRSVQIQRWDENASVCVFAQWQITEKHDRFRPVLLCLFDMCNYSDGTSRFAIRATANPSLGRTSSTSYSLTSTASVVITVVFATAAPMQ